MNGIAGIIGGISVKIFALADLFIPRLCVGCGRINPKGRYALLCNECARNIILPVGGKCKLCGEILGANNMPNVNGCVHCMDMKIAYKEVLCATTFDGAVKDIVHALKYSKLRLAADDMAKIALANPKTREFLMGAVIVPVPLYALRKMKRGFNQSELIARRICDLAPELGLRVENLLVRRKSTSTQTKLTRAERAENVKNSFGLSKSGLAEDRNKKVVILDDVITTAATINECAKTLAKAGYKNLYAFAVAKRR